LDVKYTILGAIWLNGKLGSYLGGSLGVGYVNGAVQVG